MDVMLRFPYQDEALTGPPPPSLPAGAVVRWRPLVPVTILGPGHSPDVPVWREGDRRNERGWLVSLFRSPLTLFFNRFTTVRGSSALFSYPNSYMAVFSTPPFPRQRQGRTTPPAAARGQAASNARPPAGFLPTGRWSSCISKPASQVAA
jgi:hypothetical protein